MARRRNNFSFNDFNYVDGSIELFKKTIRNSFHYDSLLDDIFEARLITVTTPMVNNPTDVSSGAGDKNEKHVFRVRILGDRSPHRFLEDPCNLDQAKDDVTADFVFSQIQNHTEVFVYDTELGVPKRGDIVRIKLERTANSFNTRKAKQYLGIARDVKESSETTTKVDCDRLDQLFKNFDFDALSSPSINEAEAQKLVDDFLSRLPAIEQLLPPELKSKTIRKTSAIRTTAEGRQMILKMATDRNISTSATKASIVNNPTETERLRQILEKDYNQDISPPESSNHNPVNGKVAIDLQITGHSSATYKLLAQTLNTYKRSMDSTTMPDYAITLIHEEPFQGTTRCPEPAGSKCGVVHVELTPNTPFGVASSTTTPQEGDYADGAANETAVDDSGETYGTFENESPTSES